MHRVWKFALFVFFLATVGSVLAQPPNPTVEIVLDQPTAQMGQTVTAEVYVRGAVNIVGADIGITVDPTCLRVIDRQTGELLPSEAPGGLSAFSELNDHDTRLQASTIRRAVIANGDGVFFRSKLEVTCETGIAPLNVSFVELSGIEDLTAQNAKFVVYRLDRGNVTTINAQLAIGPAGSVTAIPTQTLEATVTAPSTPEIAPVAPVVTSTSQNQTLLIIALSVMALSVIGLLILFVVARRRRKR